MDPKILEEIKRRNKLKMKQWEDKLKIGKIAPDAPKTEPAKNIEKPMDNKRVSNSIENAFDKVSNLKKEAEKIMPSSVNEVQNEQRNRSEVGKPNLPDDVKKNISKFDIGPADISKLNTQKNVQPQNTKTTSRQQMESQQAKEESKNLKNGAVQNPQLSPSQQRTVNSKEEVPVDPNAKQFHIDIVNGKIRITRKNMSIPEVLNILAKVYKNYKAKLKK